MKSALPLLFHAMAILLAASAVSTAADPSAEPRQFSASIGGFMGGSYKVELQGGAVTYTTFGAGRRNPKSTKITPTAAEWREFRNALDEVKVWRWRAEYMDRRVMDGTQWSLDVAFADRAVKARGSNSYPGADGRPNGRPEPTASFTRYLSAVERLIGGRTFR